ncbi:GAF domain-containing protein (plasmid) [Paracoccus liaowanqingii]|uniref:histidine kinase n=1 Tax=Paracoccus liaowanqingii TaxID=2560053 RepID=A0A4Y5STZ0_9RHOB|nr:histidine kinase dimerization/phosphoacceptor domain -containing protein [Paracoccus liaowanqingii]QDA36194.1 GAF domain-containing protein [Paracoccus liaowanqingii]
MGKDHAETWAVAPETGGSPAEELEYRLRQQQLAAEYGAYALRTHDIGALLHEATRICALGLHSRYCKVLEYLPDEGQFILRAGVGWRPGTVGHARVGADLESPTGYAFQTGEPVISNHLEGETRFRTPALLKEYGIKRAINVLIQGDGSRYGVLEVDSPTEGRFTRADLAFMQGFANLLGVAIERHYVEEALRTTEARLRTAVAHQEVLTREISHRVKNSLAMVAGLLSMQRRDSSDPSLVKALEDAEARVTTIAQVHDRLWRADEVHRVQLAAFMSELCDKISMSAPSSQTLTCAFASVSIATDQAVPLALLVNELVTNAFKYAYPAGVGDVQVTLELAGPGQMRLTVSDQGQGLPADFDAEASDSLGMTLITGLSSQLNGQLQWHNNHPGTGFVLDFAMPEQTEEKI